MTTPEDRPATIDGGRFGVTDDAVETMLRARADRLAPDASTYVMGRVHGELGARRSGGILGFLPIGDRAGAMSGWAGWGVAVAAAVLVIAVLSGRPTEDPSATSVPAGPSGSPGPSASLEAELGETVERLEETAFALAVADGSLDGQIVLVNGSLDAGSRLRGRPVSTSVTRSPASRGHPSRLERAGPSPALGSPTSTPVPGVYDWWDGPFLVRPGDGRLELLGYLAGVLGNPVTVQEALVDRRGYPNGSSRFDILPVSGYLIGCPPTASCVRSDDRLADVRPRQLGQGGEGPVTIVGAGPEPRRLRRGRGSVPRPLRASRRRVPQARPVHAPRLGRQPHRHRPVPGRGHRPGGPARHGDPVIAALTDAAVSPSPTVSEPSPRETFADDQVSPALIAEPGAMTIAAIEEEASGAWILALTVAREGKPVVTERFDLPVPDGWEPGDPAQVRISADGWVAFEIVSIEDRDTDDNAIVTMDPFGNGGVSRPIMGSAPVWLSDGTLLFTVQARLDGGWSEVARRIPDHGLGTPVDLVLPDAPPWPWFPGHYIVDGDGSGILASKDVDPVSMTIRWDGTMVERDAGAPPYLDLGAERWAGADGEVVVHCGFDTCPAEWRRPGGSRLPYPFLEQATAWLPDGSALLVLDDGVLKEVHDEGGAALMVRTIGAVPADGLLGASFAITGITGWAAAIEGDDSRVTLVPLDGSAPVGPFAGTLAAVGS